MLRLRTLGTFGLTDDSGTQTLLPPHRFALLALVAAAGDRGVPRDKALVYLWPEATPPKARAALEQMLHALRVSLGNRSMLLGNPLRLDPRIVSSDVADFRAAFSAGDPARAVDVYRGPFLDGFHLSGVPEFEEWVESERRQLAEQNGAALERLADEAAERGDYAREVDRLRALGAMEPLSGRITVRLMQALARSGDRAAALDVARQHAARLRAELGVEPDPSVSAFADDVRQLPHMPTSREGAASGSDGAFPPAVATADTRPSPALVRHVRSSRSMALVIAGVVAAAITGGITTWFARRASPGAAQTVATFTVPLGVHERMGDSGQTLAISPDGSQYVYSASSTGGRRLYLRAIDRIAATAIPGSDGASNPFFSPDGKSIGFVVGGKLMLLQLGSAQPTTIAHLKAPFSGASWGANDTILFAEGRRGIFRVAAAAGAEPQLVARPRPGEGSYWWPSQLPEGAILFAVLTGMDWDATRIVALRPESGELQTLLDHGNYPKYIPTGHLLFAGVATGRVGVSEVRSVAFDARRLKVLSKPVTVIDSVAFALSIGRRAAQFDVARNGSLVYVRPRSAIVNDSLLWVDRQQRSRVIDYGPRRSLYFAPSISPDGALVGLTTIGDSMETWILDLRRRTPTLLERGAHRSHFTVWSPGGERIVTSSDRGDSSLNLYVHGHDDSKVQRLTHSAQHQDPASWSPDEKWLMYANQDPATDWDIWMLDFTHTPPSTKPLIRTNAGEYSAMISPNGRWLAYVSNASGRAEVYVERFPQLGARQQVSRSGGRDPLWSRAGDELFFTASDSSGSIALWSVEVRHQGELTMTGPRVVLRHGPNASVGYGRPSYDVSLDGQRFLIVRRGARIAAAQEFVTVLNWLTELERRVPYPK